MHKLTFIGLFSILLAACSAGRSSSDTGSGRRDGGMTESDSSTTACTPNTFGCEGNTRRQCAADGSGWTDLETCDSAVGSYCASGSCASLCDIAAQNNSYFGCEYYAVTSSNPSLSVDFSFAIAVTNVNGVDASVSITRGSTSVGTYVIAPGAQQTIELPYVEALRAAYTDSDTDRTFHSALVRDGAYHIESNVPVTVYQFNALDYRLDSDCSDEREESIGDGQCFSFTNDASLLLPVHSLTGNYTVLAYPSQRTEVLDFGSVIGGVNTPSFFTVTGAAEGTVDVSITFAGNALGSIDGSTLRAYNAGESGTFALGPGDVLQIQGRSDSSCASGSPSDSIDGEYAYRYCTPGRGADLSGTQVRATGKVAVLAGHACAFVPYDRWACDHLEETMLPEDAWGRDFVVSITRPLQAEPNLIRIVSSDDGNALTFDPPVRGSATLNRGEVLEFTASESFRVVGTKALLVGQFLVGQDYAGYGTSPAEGQGDPSLSLAVPQEQYRTRYDFLAPTTYATNFVNVVAQSGTTVTLDGANVEGFEPIGSSGYSVTSVAISGGAHTIESSSAFGIVVYGFGSYTSYMYPGGLNLEVINLL